MSQSEAEAPPAIVEAAHILMRNYGPAALGIAAISASRTLRAESTDETAFWLCVCDIIRSRHDPADAIPADAVMH